MYKEDLLMWANKYEGARVDRIDRLKRMSEWKDLIDLMRERKVSLVDKAASTYGDERESHLGEVRALNWLISFCLAPPIDKN